MRPHRIPYLTHTTMSRFSLLRRNPARCVHQEAQTTVRNHWSHATGCLEKGCYKGGNLILGPSRVTLSVALYPR
jgi:hypothetical protein